MSALVLCIIVAVLLVVAALAGSRLARRMVMVFAAITAALALFVWVFTGS